MSENFCRTTRITKAVVESAGGVVAAQHQTAADVGAQVLREGGNAVDAAVATACAVPTLEPWMSGAGGGGFMVVHNARSGQTKIVDFGMIAPRGLDPGVYELIPGKAGDLFGWQAVVEDRNIKGFHSIAVPGQVDGLATALKEFGTWSWQRVLAPAIELAERGMIVDWYTSVMITSAAKDLASSPTARATYLPGGFPWAVDYLGTTQYLKIPNLAHTLKRLHDAGPRDFYEGEIAQKLVADLRAGGSTVAPDDLRQYHARIGDALEFDYGGARLRAAPGLTAGPTYKRVLESLAGKLPRGRPDPGFYAQFAVALMEAYAERLVSMGERDTPSCTTNLVTVDRDGNMVALTQTLLSLFGSRVMLPETGLMMNNGIMWFDPRPGLPNSIAPGKRPLSNMCPVVATKDGKPWFALGASGGRRIMPAIAQLTSFLVDYGMSLEQAFHAPRIDASGAEPVVCDSNVPEGTVAAIARRYQAKVAGRMVLPLSFACPTGVMVLPDGAKQGIAEVGQPWASASGA
jgi:gamma-glutamyltranspeptidase/glutathione hydrolase